MTFLWKGTGCTRSRGSALIYPDLTRCTVSDPISLEVADLIVVCGYAPNSSPEYPPSLESSDRVLERTPAGSTGGIQCSRGNDRPGRVLLRELARGVLLSNICCYY